MNWNASDYMIPDKLLDKFIKDQINNLTVNEEAIRGNTEAFNDALASWQDGKTSLGQALDAATTGTTGARAAADDAVDELPGRDADGDGYSGQYAEPDDTYGKGGVLLKPFIDFFVTIGDVVMNLIQQTMKNEKFEIETLSMANYLVRNDSEDLSIEYEEEMTGGREGNEAPIQITVDTDKFDKGWLSLDDTFYYPNTKYSPEEIFANQVGLLRVNFFKDEGNQNRIDLRKTIANWYRTLRNFAVVALLSVLIYIGIRMVISSSSADKAKYKQMILDWLIALCLVFFMHYIMAFTMTVVDAITEGISGGGKGTVEITAKAGEETLKTFSTNLLGAARFQAQYKNIGKRGPYVIMYLALVAYTVMFTFYYLKRLLMMAFLTMIAPIVAITYPIDKINDGKAQAFDSWLKEYVYNALLQPFHLVIFYVFVTSALELASTNVIYTAAAMWFVLQAEKILRGFFGFNKAGAGTMDALHALGLSSIIGQIASGTPKIREENSSPSKQIEGNKPIRSASNTNLDSLKSLDGSTENENAQKRMLEADEESYGTSNFDEHAFNANAEELNKDDEGRKYSLEERKQILKDSGYTDEEIAEELKAEKKAEKERNKGKGEISRLVNYHWENIARKKPIRRAIKGIAKTGLKHAYRAGVGSLAAAVTLASGGDAKAAMATYAAAAGLTERGYNAATRGVGKAVKGIPNAWAREVDVARGNNEETKARELKEKLNNPEIRDYVRNKALKEEGKMLSRKQITEILEKNYAPYLKHDLSMDEASRIMEIAKKKDIGLSNEAAATMFSHLKASEIDKATLNDENKRKQAIKNIRAEYANKDISEELADKAVRLADGVYGIHGFDDVYKKEPKKQGDQRDKKTKKS